jgi:glycosyltransferase involved in cell wall biosynthesis
MKISVVTPSLSQSEWLKLCVASVADQASDVEHIVQDAGSKDGTLDWLRDDPRVRVFVEKDDGMYDAVNRGLRRAEGEVFCYLNCDEQYLPGAMERVREAFEEDPDLDVLFGDVIIVGPQCEFLAYRKSASPLESVVCANPSLPILTCATFFRRRVFEERGFEFDTRWRDLGDADWLLRVVRAGLKMSCLRQYTSVFALTGANMNDGPNAIREKKEMRAMMPRRYRIFRSLIRAGHWWRKLRQGCYRQPPFKFQIYGRDNQDDRQTFSVSKPTFRYPRSPIEG